MANTFYYEEPTSPEDLASFYRKLEPFLHPRNTSSMDQKKVKVVVILGDSFMVERRVIDDMGETPFKHIPMLPHATKGAHPESENRYRCARIENLSRGGGTMEKMLRDEKAMDTWIEDVPALTIMHLGGCDIASGDIDKEDGRNGHRKTVELFMKTWLLTAEEKIKKHNYGNVATKQKMKDRLKSHKWLIVSIPDWGRENNNIRGVTPKVHTDTRRRYNNALKCCSTYFWREFKAVVFNVGFLREERNPDDIHYSNREQRQYNEIIFSVARKLLCDFCNWEVDEGRRHLQRDRNICKEGRFGNIPKDQLEKVDFCKLQQGKMPMKRNWTT